MSATDVRTDFNMELGYRALATSATLLALAAIFLALALADTDQPTAAIIWGSLSLASFAFGLLFMLQTQEQPDLGLARWQFGPWILLWYGVAFGLATLTWIQPQEGVAAEIRIQSVLRALWLVAVGITVWTAGYVVGPGHPALMSASRVMKALSHRFASEVRSPASPWLLYLIGIGARLSSTATTGRFGYAGDVSSVVTTATGYGQVLTTISLCAPLAVATAALQVYREGIPQARLTLAVLFFTELIFGAAAGGKQSFVIAVLAVAIPFSAARRRLPTGALIAFCIIFLVAVIPFNRAYREAVRNGSNTLSPSQAIATAPLIFKASVEGQSPLTLVPGSVDYLLQRIREIDTPAIIMQRTPSQIAFSNPFQLFEEAGAGFIPRAIWPSKPIITTGYQISQDYYEVPSTVYTSSAITPIADLYRHRGWVTLIAGMFLLGCGVKLLDKVLDVRSNPHAIFLVLLLFPMLVKNEDDWGTMIASIPSTILIWLVAVALTFRRQRRREDGGPPAIG